MTHQVISPQVYITRNKTSITTQKFWEKHLITSTVGTRSSIAVRRPAGNVVGDRIFVAQVENGNALIKWADVTINIASMVWQTLTTIENVSELSIMFDGYMKLVEGRVETYTTGDVPYVFYVDSTGSLKYLNLDDESIFGTISDAAVNIASVRGLYSEAISMDDGILVYYTNSLGQLWEAIVLHGEVSELTQITLKPTGVTAWVDIWAGTTFDYRIVLQLKANDGKVYTLMSASRPSGFGVGQEYITITKAEITGVLGLTPPNIVSIELVSEINFSPTKTFKLVYDGPVYNVSNLDIPNLKLVSATGEAYQQEYSPYLITQGGASEVIVYFNNITRLLNSIVFKGTSLRLGSPNLGADNFEIGLNAYEITNTYNGNEYLTIGMASVTGDFIQTVYVNAFVGGEYLTIDSAAVGGTLYKLIFEKGYTQDEYVTVVSAAVTGVLCDVDGTPI